MRLLHLSDLHFCTEPLARRLHAFQQTLPASLRSELSIHAADSVVLSALSRLIGELDPDLVVITGDITTFGDTGSFEVAFDWLKNHFSMRQGAIRNFVVVPGNHDILRYQLGKGLPDKIETLPWFVRIQLKTYLRNAIKALRELIECTGGALETDPTAGLAAFSAFVGKDLRLTNSPFEIALCPSARAVVFPYNSVSVDVWMNLGRARETDTGALVACLKDPKYKVGTLRIAALHHNPISAPSVAESELVNAYNSMPSGSQFMRTLQAFGVDLLLHGHQHEAALLRYDYFAGPTEHVYAVGCGSSTSPDGGSCNVFDIAEPNHATLKRYSFRRSAGTGTFEIEPGAERELSFERNRPEDAGTRSTRQEIKRYYVPGHSKGVSEAQLFDELARPGASLLWVTGRSMNDLRLSKFRPLEEYLKFSEDAHLRLLINNSQLLQTLDSRLRDATREELWDKRVLSPNGRPEDRPGALLWGSKEELRTLASDAEQTIEALEAFISDLSQVQRRRIDVRVSHTLIPYGATVREPCRPWSQMAVRLLPQGAVGQLHSPILRLNRRRDASLFDFFVTHLRFLLSRGRTILGEWTGAEDLAETAVKSTNA